MTKEGILILWGVLVVMFSAIAGGVVAHTGNRHVGDGGAAGMVVGLVIDLVLFAIYATLNLKSSSTAPAATPPTSTADPDVVRQVQDIVNSGSEPALIVEELRRLTEAKS